MLTPGHDAVGTSIEDFRMARNVAVDPALLERAFRGSGERTHAAVVTKAL